MAEQTNPTATPGDEGNGGTATATRTRRSTVTVKSPNRNFTGVKVNVVFNNGVAKVDSDNEAALGYFRTAGYDVGGGRPDEREDLPVDRVPVAPQTFDGNDDEQSSRVDVAVPPPSAGVEEWRIFARGYNLHTGTGALDLKKATKQDIIDRATALGLI